MAALFYEAEEEEVGVAVVGEHSADAAAGVFSFRFVAGAFWEASTDFGRFP